MEHKLLEILENKYYKNLKNINHITNKKVFICFSGVSGSGKTTLAKEIEKKLKTIRINKDDIRKIVYKYFRKKISTFELEHVISDYLEFLMEKLCQVDNGLILIDSSSDRRFSTYKKWAKKYGYKIFLIRLETDKEFIIKRMEDRSNNLGNKYYWSPKIYETELKDFNLLNRKRKSDFKIKNNNKKTQIELLTKLKKSVLE